MLFLGIFPLFVAGQKSEIINNTVHSPRKATIFSAVLPGLGQAYNKKYWKIPIAYAGIGAFGYFTWSNQHQFNNYRNAYIKLSNNEPNDYPDFNKEALLT